MRKKTGGRDQIIGDSAVFEEAETNSLVYSFHSQHGTSGRSHRLVEAMGLGTNSNCAINKLCRIVSVSLGLFCIKQVSYLLLKVVVKIKQNGTQDVLTTASDPRFTDNKMQLITLYFLLSLIIITTCSSKTKSEAIVKTTKPFPQGVTLHQGTEQSSRKRGTLGCYVTPTLYQYIFIRFLSHYIFFHYLYNLHRFRISVLCMCF